MGERAERCEWYIQYHPPSLLIPSKLLDIDTLGVDPNDLEEEEFTAYAEEHGLHLDDLTVDDIFGLSDLDETDLEHTTYSEQGGGGKHEIDEEDIDMDL